MDVSYLLAFTAGLLGGFGHCIGMCGPIVTAYSLQRTLPAGIKNNPVPEACSRVLLSGILNRGLVFDSIIPHILYNAGRISTYIFIGGLMGLIGSFVDTAGRLAGIQNIASIAAGIFMVTMGLGIVGVSHWLNILERHNNFILKLIKVFALERSAWRYYPMGALLGFLPCGLSYSVFIASAGTGNVVSGMSVSAMFGIGTIPALLLFGMIIAYLGSKTRGIIYRASGLVVIAMGLYFILRAAGINV